MQRRVWGDRGAKIRLEWRGTNAPVKPSGVLWYWGQKFSRNPDKNLIGFTQLLLGAVPPGKFHTRSQDRIDA